MTLLPMWKKCPKCHKKYDWNPDVGRFFCPYCYGLGKQKKFDLKGVLGRKKEGDVFDKL